MADSIVDCSERVDFTFIIPTFNSALTLSMALESIRRQQYDQERIEVLVIDGGSTDDTTRVAESCGARVLENARRLPEYAKLIGVQRAKGRFLVFHDSDEVLSDQRSLERRRAIFNAHPMVHSIATSGYAVPSGFPGWSDYTNIVGDPFSRFIYDGGGGDAWDALPLQYPSIERGADYAILSVGEGNPPPLFDACSHSVRAAIVHRLFPNGISPPQLVEVIPRVVLETGRFAVLKDDLVLHYSSSSFGQIVRKIRFRVINNVFATEGASAGYANRSHLLPVGDRLRKWLYIPYALSIVLPFLDGVRFALKRHRLAFLVHPLFSLSVLVFVCWYTMLRSLGRDVRTSRYG